MSFPTHCAATQRTADFSLYTLRFHCPTLFMSLRRHHSVTIRQTVPGPHVVKTHVAPAHSANWSPMQVTSPSEHAAVGSAGVGTVEGTDEGAVSSAAARTAGGWGAEEAGLVSEPASPALVLGGASSVVRRSSN